MPFDEKMYKKIIAIDIFCGIGGLTNLIKT